MRNSVEFSLVEKNSSLRLSGYLLSPGRLHWLVNDIAECIKLIDRVIQPLKVYCCFTHEFYLCLFSLNIVIFEFRIKN